MTKFNAPVSTRPVATSPVTTTGEPIAETFEGAPAWVRSAESELFLLAITNMVSEDTFYESAQVRDFRFAALVEHVTQSNPEWLQAFIPWLRSTANMRSAPVVALAHYVAAGGPGARALIARTLLRADEPAELLGYWWLRFGRTLPKPLKRGIADAATKLYDEYSALKYDGQSKAIRMADVIELTHPKPKDNNQAALFRWLLDRRHQGTAKADGRILKTIKAREKFESVPENVRRSILKGVAVESWVTWEWLSGWLPGGMDKDAWEAVIPQMGYMALLRNLRNFDQAQVSVPYRNRVIERLADRDQVARSRQFPFRFLSAYKNTGTLHWAVALETALELSTANIPAFEGRTLILTDTSGSMQGTISGRSTVRHFEVAGLFAAAVGSRSGNAELVSFADRAERLPFSPGDSVLKTMDLLNRRNGKVGHGTDVNAGLGYYGNHDRIVVFSDMQVAHRARFPKGVPVYLFNTGGYATSPVETGTGLVHEIGGFSDAAFRLIPLLEQGRSADWPWEVE